jgi:hypothetical protein
MSFRIGDVLEELQNGELRKYVFQTVSCGVFFLSPADATCERGLSLSEAERKRIEEEEKELAYQKETSQSDLTLRIGVQ